MACVRPEARLTRERFIAFACATADGMSDDAVLMVECGWVTRAMVCARALLGPPEERLGWLALVQRMEAAGCP